MNDGDGNKDSEGQRGKKKEEAASKRDDNRDGWNGTNEGENSSRANGGRKPIGRNAGAENVRRTTRDKSFSRGTGKRATTRGACDRPCALCCSPGVHARKKKTE